MPLFEVSFSQKWYTINAAYTALKFLLRGANYDGVLSGLDKSGKLLFKNAIIRVVLG